VYKRKSVLHVCHGGQIYAATDTLDESRRIQHELGLSAGAVVLVCDVADGLAIKNGSSTITLLRCKELERSGRDGVPKTKRVPAPPKPKKRGKPQLPVGTLPPSIPLPEGPPVKIDPRSRPYKQIHGMIMNGMGELTTEDLKRLDVVLVSLIQARKEDRARGPAQA